MLVQGEGKEGKSVWWPRVICRTMVTWSRELGGKKMSGFWIYLEGKANLTFFFVIHLNLISHFLFSGNPLCKCDNLRGFPKHSIWNSLLTTCHSLSYPAFSLIVLSTQNDIIYEFFGLLIICPSKYNAFFMIAQVDLCCYYIPGALAHSWCTYLLNE